MHRATFSTPWRGDSARVWKVCSLVSILLHGLVLGALAFALPVNFAKPPDTSVSIDLDMVATGEPQPEPSLSEPAALPEPQVAEPEKAIEPEPEPAPAPKKAEAPKPKPVPKKAERSKQEQPRKTAAANARSDGQSRQLANNVSPAAKTVATSTGAPSTPPAPLGGSSTPRPPYPELARKRGQEGTVNIRCQVDAQGNVTAVAIAKSSGFKLLDDAALKTVGKWKFRAGSKDGASVAGTVVVPVQFKLQ